MLKIKLKPCITPYTQEDSGYTKGSNAKNEMVKLMEEYGRENICDQGVRMNFLNEKKMVQNIGGKQM